MLRFFRKLHECESGATAVEYGLIAGLISLVIIGILGTVGNDITQMFNYISTAVQGALSRST